LGKLGERGSWCAVTEGREEIAMDREEQGQLSGPLFTQMLLQLLSSQ